MDFSYLEGHMPSRFQHSMQFTENFSHRPAPIVQFFGHREFDRLGIETQKPAAKPIIGCIIDHVQKWRGSDYQRNRLCWDLRGLGGWLGEQQRMPGSSGQA